MVADGHMDRYGEANWHFTRLNAKAPEEPLSMRHSVFLWHTVTAVVRVYYNLQEITRK